MNKYLHKLSSVEIEILLQKIKLLYFIVHICINSHLYADTELEIASMPVHAYLM
jgi:hypothetical protein